MRTPAGEVTLDPTGRLNGRGAYVDRDPACIDLAIDRGLLDRALEIRIPAGFRSELLAATQTDIAGGARGQE